MFAQFVVSLRAAGVPASITEYLALLRAMQAGVAEYSVEDFYFLSRAALVKDERHLDRFDRVFGQVFRGPRGDGRRRRRGTGGAGAAGRVAAHADGKAPHARRSRRRSRRWAGSTS